MGDDESESIPDDMSEAELETWIHTGSLFPSENSDYHYESGEDREKRELFEAGRDEYVRGGWSQIGGYTLRDNGSIIDNGSGDTVFEPPLHH